jgi:hypothetical protein
LREGIEIGASVDTGRSVEDHCFTIDSPQHQIPDRSGSFELGPRTKPVPNCRVVNPFRGQTQIKVHGVYLLPLPGDIVVRAIYENLSGSAHEAYWAAPNALIAPSLGRNLAACGTRAVCTATARVPLIQPFTQFEPRRTLLDLRFSKMIALAGGARLRANFDIHNVPNNDAILSLNDNYGAAWLQPAGGLGGAVAANRLVQFGGQLTF